MLKVPNHSQGTKFITDCSEPKLFDFALRRQKAFRAISLCASYILVSVLQREKYIIYKLLPCARNHVNGEHEGPAKLKQYISSFKNMKMWFQYVKKK